MVILIMEFLTAFNVKINVMLVLLVQIFVYHVTELIGFHGLHPIMIARKYYLIQYLDAFKDILMILDKIVHNVLTNVQHV